MFREKRPKKVRESIAHTRWDWDEDYDDEGNLLKVVPPKNLRNPGAFLDLFMPDFEHLYVDAAAVAKGIGFLDYAVWKRKIYEESSKKRRWEAACFLTYLMAKVGKKKFMLREAQVYAPFIRGLPGRIEDYDYVNPMYDLLARQVAVGRLERKQHFYIVTPEGERMDNVSLRPKRKTMTRDQQEAARRLLIYETLKVTGGKRFTSQDLRTAARDFPMAMGMALTSPEIVCRRLTEEGLIKEVDFDLQYKRKYFLPTDELLKTSPDTLRVVLHST